jgi:hypothetical protein
MLPSKTKKPDLQRRPDNQVLPADAVTIQRVNSTSFTSRLNAPLIKT